MRARRSRRASGTILIIGLGRFGTSVAETLIEMGHEVLAVDEDETLVQKYADDFTHTMQVDATDPDALEQIGAGQFEKVIVAIGTDVEASIMTVLALSEAGVPNIWAKAISRKHGQILERIGAHHVVYPERTMGERVAHTVAGNLYDYFELEDDYAFARTRAPEFTWGRSLTDSDVRRKCDVTVVGVKRDGAPVTYAKADTMIEKDDQLIVSGRRSEVEKFCRLL
ncbi:potassium channel family protein [Enemella sp. A6]|uniref:potassium channel family protein n=1 Tax=Enemella sp. A6 TaxID=3440152 RepID=UPI003EBF8BDF